MPKPTASFGQRKTKTQAYILRAGREQGLSRQETIDRYNRGTLGGLGKARGHGSSGAPEHRKDAVKHPDKYPEYWERRERQAPQGSIERQAKEEQAYNRMVDLLEDRPYFNRYLIQENVEAMRLADLERIIQASEAELRQIASQQKPADANKRIPEKSWLTMDGKTYNPFWYHAGSY